MKQKEGKEKQVLIQNLEWCAFKMGLALVGGCLSAAIPHQSCLS